MPTGRQGTAGHSLCSNPLFDAFVKTRKRGFVQPPFSRLSQKVMPSLPLPAQKQFYSVNPCGESMANWVYALQGGKGKTVTDTREIDGLILFFKVRGIDIPFNISGLDFPPRT
jgi:hypothetical protein